MTKEEINYNKFLMKFTIVFSLIILLLISALVLKSIADYKKSKLNYETVCCSDFTWVLIIDGNAIYENKDLNKVNEYSRKFKKYEIERSCIK